MSETVKEILDDIYSGSPLKIAETGCVSTQNITKWVSQHSNCEFVSVDLDTRRQVAEHKALECQGLAKHYTLLTQDHNKFLSEQTWLDVVFILPADLQSGLEEFSLAVSTGAATIVTYDFQTRSALAIRKAQALGWTAEHKGMYSILRRPN